MIKVTQAIMLSLILVGCDQSEDSNNTSTDVQAQKQENKAASATQNLEKKIDVSPEKLSLESVADVTKQDISEIHDQLKSLTQDLSCDNSSQCHVEAVGKRACGGPSSYLVYSSKSASSEEVTELAKKITRYESSYNFENQIMSICEQLTRPSTQCVENKCVTLSDMSQEAY
ncbi:hypothetical protein [Pseudoalteromonas byunsanensis]|uniref:Lipoprotein n=1 Tax=Pseudoalteromonas byunsanensis TaxID=327939 RepID=A0A1S1NEF9_9GAMM|nr:hypothetical protein [Pseudoalteromonas byunsanensis]OHU98014.1 hypothetical protein BIW53_00360 [Pseudoalteromonas byunsanensis]